MDVRPADSADRARIEALARESFRTSYALSPNEIETIVEEAFSAESLERRLDDPDVRCLVAEVDGEVVGFAEVDGDDTLRWLHVDPAARGRGAGTALFERVRKALAEREVPLTARILESASEGSGFLERFDLTRTGTAHLEFERERFPEVVFAVSGDPLAANEPSVEVPGSVSVEGRDLAVDRDDEIPGSESPFFGLHADGADERWGFFCSECGSTDVSADGLDRLECGSCGNTHRADRWDEAYL